MDEPGNQPAGAGGPSPPSRLRNINATLDVFEVRIKAIDAARAKAEKDAREWEQRYKESEEEYRRQASECRELGDKYADKCRELEQAQWLLQNSIPLADWINPPQKLRTTAEMSPEEKLKVLEEEQNSLREMIKQLREAQSS